MEGVFMSKNRKYILLACALFLTGAVLTTTALLIGGDFLRRPWQFNINNGNVREEQEQIIPLEPFSAIQAKIDAADVLIRRGDAFQLRLTDADAAWEIQLNNRQLQLTQQYPDSARWKLLDQKLLDRFVSRRAPGVEISIPAGSDLESIRWDQGVGSIRLEHIAAAAVDIDSGVTDINLTDMTSSAVMVKSGVGNITAEVTSETAEIELGTGEINLTGKIEGDIRLDVGVGNIQVRLEGPKTLYHYQVDMGIGSSSFNGRHGSFPDSRIESNYTLSAHSGIGNIDIIIDEAFYEDI
jgi:hypothetical protein